MDADIQRRVEAATAQLRSDQVHQARLLTEHYLRRIAELEAERDAIQAARDEEAQQAVEEYENLDMEKTQLEIDKGNLETGKDELEEEKDDLEDEIAQCQANSALLLMQIGTLQIGYDYLE